MAEDYSNLISEAYGSIGVANPDVEGQQYWAGQLSSGALNPADFQRTFLTAASGVTDPAYAANVARSRELLAGPVTSGITSLPSNNVASVLTSPNYEDVVSQAYQNILGRAGDVEGQQYWNQQLTSGAIKPQDLASTMAQAAIPVATKLEDRLALQKYLGKDIYAPEDYLKGTSGLGYKDVVDYINANVQDPVKIAQYAAQYGIDPTEILSAKQAVGGQDIPTVKAIEDYIAQGKSGFEPRFESIVSSVLGPAEDRAALEKSLNLEPGTIKSKIDSSKFSEKSLENIEKELQYSGLNKYQEAVRAAGIAQNIYGLSKEEASKLGSDLYNGTADKTTQGFYDEMLTNGFSPDVQTKILQHAATTTPESPYFQKNPEALKVYKPIGELKSSEEQKAGQYDYVNNAPILSASEADRLLGGDVYKGGTKDFNYFDGKDDKLGWVLNSKYASSMANGAGVFGLQSNKSDINKFDQAEKEIAKSGGIQTEADPEGGTFKFIYEKTTDPETGREVSVRKPLNNMFQGVDDSGMPTGTSYEDYQNAKAALEKGASQLGIDSSKYSSIKDLYNAVNEKSKDLYVVTGRANRWDTDIAEEQGITGVGKERGGINHATVLYKRVGDKLVPIETVKKFNFDDPNTSRGFFGDIATGIGSIMSIPPIQAALMMGGGLPALFQGTFGTPAASSAASSLAASLGSSASSALGLGLGEVGQNVLGNALLSGGLGGLTTGLMTGDLSKAGTAALAGGIGGGITAGMPNVIKGLGINVSPDATRAASEIVGGAAATAVTGQDPGAYAINRLLGTGISALTSLGSEKAGISSNGAGNEILKAMIPIIMTKQVDPSDVIKLSSALSKAQKTG